MARMLHPLNGRTMFDTLEPAGPLKEQLDAGSVSVSATPAILNAVAERAAELQDSDAGMDSQTATLQVYTAPLPHLLSPLYAVPSTNLP